MTEQMTWGAQFLTEVDRRRRSVGLGQTFSWRARQIMPQLSQSDLLLHARRHRYATLQAIRANDGEAAARLLYRNREALRSLQESLCEYGRPMREWEGLLESLAGPDTYGARFLRQLLQLKGPLPLAAADVHELRAFSQEQLVSRVRRCSWQLGQIVETHDAQSAAAQLDQQFRLHQHQQNNAMMIILMAGC